MYKIILRVADDLLKLKSTSEFPSTENCGTIFNRYSRKKYMKMPTGTTEPETATRLTISMKQTERHHKLHQLMNGENQDLKLS